MRRHYVNFVLLLAVALATLAVAPVANANQIKLWISPASTSSSITAQSTMPMIYSAGTARFPRPRRWERPISISAALLQWITSLSGLYADICINGVSGIPLGSSDGEVDTTEAGYVDLLSSTGSILRLPLEDTIVYRLGDTDNAPVVIDALASGGDCPEFPRWIWISASIRETRSRFC